LKTSLRRFFRLGRFLTRCARAGIDRPTSDPLSRAHWNRRHAVGFARALGLEVKVEGDPGDAQAWIGNHLGYLDIVGLATVKPVTFVAKAEVREWPVLGGLARRGGTIFIERSRRMAVAGATDSMEQSVQSGVPVVFFPEGTSSGGERVLPFHAPLFGPAVKAGWKVAPFALSFECRGPSGLRPEYWGDMTFGPHFLGMLGHGGLTMRIRFGKPEKMEGDRKELSLQWRDKVVALHRGLRG